MPDTVREDIFANIKTSLQAITTGNGFDNTITTVKRYNINDETLGPYPMVIINPGTETNQEQGKDFSLTHCQMQVILEVWINPQASETTPTDKLLNSLLGDIKKKLKEDITRGGKAIDTRFAEIEPFEQLTGQSEAGYFITIVVEYRHLQTNPKTAL